MRIFYQLIFGISIVFMLTILQCVNSELFGNYQDPSILLIKKCSDFKITGDGVAENWSKTDWIMIPMRTKSDTPLTTKVKILYSDTGIYFLFDCQDNKLTSVMNADFMDLWYEDVVEVFLWTDESSPVYFEYEISPLNYELPILISNEKFDLVRWQPFHYDADRKTSHATSVQGREKKSNAVVKGWTAEFFIPYKLLRPLKNIVPKSGTKWRANMYRMDYDNRRTSWSWQLTTRSFHDYEKFGTFIFE
jgi:hypothetical protein